MLQEAVSYSIPCNNCVRLVQITDPHLFADVEGQLLGVNTAKSLNAVLDTFRAVQYPADFMLATGDISQDYSPESYRSFVRAISPLNLPCHFLPGNHDDPRIMHLHMQGPKVHGYKRILAGKWQIIMLDSTVRGKPGGFLAPAELALIDEAVAAFPEHYTLLVMHHNPVLANCTWLDQHCLANGEAFLAHISQYAQVRGVLWGHIHQQLDIDYPRAGAPLHLMATPSTCIQFKPQSHYFALDIQQPGYRLLELRPDGSMLTNVYRVPGDRFSPDKDASGY